MSISTLAYIHPDAKIGTNVVIEPFSYIHHNVEIGHGTWIGPNVTILEGSRIGQNCKIFPGAVIGAEPQDLKFKGEKTLAIIGDHTTIRECVTVNRGTDDRHQTVVGSHCLLMAYVHVAHDCIIGNHCVLANTVQIAGHVTIGDFAIIGGTSAVHQFVAIGSHVMISGGSLVKKDVPPYTKAAREPLSYVGINAIGLKRRGFSTDTINNIQDTYRILYNGGYNNSHALEVIAEKINDSAERNEIIRFVKESPRGIMKGYKSGHANVEED